MKDMSGMRVTGFGLAVLVGVLSMASCSNSVVNSGAISKQESIQSNEHPQPVNAKHRRMAIGATAVAGVKDDGTVWTWGSGIHGELGDGQAISFRKNPVRISSLNEIVEISGTWDHFLALKKDGTVWSWGNNDRGQLGYETDNKYSAEPRMIPGIRNAISIATGSHSLVLGADGSVYAFGSNSNAELGLGAADNKPHFVPIKSFSIANGVKVYARGGRSALLGADGKLYYWGADSYTDERVRSVSLTSADIENVVDASISDSLYALTADGFVMAKNGSNRSGQLGQGDFKTHQGFVRVNNISRVISIASAIDSGLALDEQGRIWQWGDSVRFSSKPTVKVNKEPLPVLVAKLPGAVELFSNTANAVLLSNGEVYFWGIDGGRHGRSNHSAGIFAGDGWFSPRKSDWSWK